MKDWVRINADMELGAYKITVARGAIPEPEWPNLTFEELLEIAFRDRIVSSPFSPARSAILGRCLMLSELPFKEIWAVDFEFNGKPGDRPNPVCMVARELRCVKEPSTMGR